MQIEISGITIEVRKKKIKKLNLTVSPPNGEVRVSAPLFLSDEKIIAFLKTKLDWIKKKQEKFTTQQIRSEREYVSGETLCLFGRQYLLRVEYGKNSLTFSENEVILTVRKESTPKQREKLVNEWYRTLLKAQIEIYLPKWEQITGLYCNSWQIKYMKTRWGTCNTNTRKIWLNLQLAQKPLECLEYVILHELAHLKVHNHGKDFVAVMDKYMPNWREIKKLLNGQK